MTTILNPEDWPDAHGLSEGLDRFLDKDRIHQLRSEALGPVISAAQELLTTDLAERVPQFVEQWEAWKDGVIDPIRTSGNMADTVDFKVTVGNDGHVSEVGASLIPDVVIDPDLRDANTWLSLAKGIHQRHGINQVSFLQPETVTAARVIGYPTLAKEFNNGLFKPKVERQYVIPGDFLAQAALHRHEVLGAAVVRGLNYTLHPGTENVKVHGRVFDPANPRKDVDHLSVYQDYDPTASHKTIYKFLERLRLRDLAAIAAGRVSQEVIARSIQHQEKEDTAELERNLELNRRVLDIITDSPDFRELVD